MGALIDSAAGLALAKRYYAGKIREAYTLLPGKKNFFDKDTQGKVQISDAGGFFPMATNPNMQGGFFTDGGPLTFEGASSYVQAQFGFTNYSQAIQLTGQQIDTLDREGPHAFANILQTEIDRAVQGFNKMLNRYINFDNKGVLALVSSNSTASTTIATASSEKAYFLAKDMVITAVNPGSGVARANANVRIVSIAADLSSIVVSESIGSGDWVAGDYIVQRNSYNIALQGLDYHISATTWLGLDRSGQYANLLGITKSAGSVDVSASILEEMAQRMYQLGIEDTGCVAAWGPDQAAKYKAAGYALKRFNDETVNLGFDEVEFGDFRFFRDRDNPIGTIYFFKPSNFFWVVVKELEWGTPDGQTLHQLVQEAGSGATAQPMDKYYAPLIWRGQLVTDMPHHLGLVNGLAYDAVYRSRSHVTFG
jgi:hypothetical protein